MAGRERRDALPVDFHNDREHRKKLAERTNQIERELQGSTGAGVVGVDSSGFSTNLTAAIKTLQDALDEIDALTGSTFTAVVLKSLFDANTILAANADNTPLALAVAEQRLLGRITGGNIAALTAAQVKTLLGIGSPPEVFRSTGSAITANATHPFTHGLSGEPDFVIVIIQCTTANLNWSVGDRVIINVGIEPVALGAETGIFVQVDSTNVTVYVMDDIQIANKSTFESDPITLGSWDMYVKAVYFG